MITDPIGGTGGRSARITGVVKSGPNKVWSVTAVVFADALTGHPVVEVKKSTQLELLRKTEKLPMFNRPGFVGPNVSGLAKILDDPTAKVVRTKALSFNLLRTFPVIRMFFRFPPKLDWHKNWYSAAESLS